jgi:hypothetical protein
MKRNETDGCRTGPLVTFVPDLPYDRSFGVCVTILFRAEVDSTMPDETFMHQLSYATFSEYATLPSVFWPAPCQGPSQMHRPECVFATHI